MAVYTVCGTGHRGSKFKWYSWNKTDAENEKHPDCLAIKQALYSQVEMLIQNNYKHFISGMALGFDTWLAETVISLKEKYPDIILEAAIPCKNQDRKWTEEQQERYKQLLEKCDIKTYVTKGEYTKLCMNQRNYYMVDHSDMVISCYDGTAGGTRNAFCYAIDKKVNIININPVSKKIEYIQNK